MEGKKQNLSHFSSSLFTTFAEIENVPIDEIYRNYLRKILVIEGNLNINILTNEQLKLFYTTGGSGLPKYFNPSKFFDISRLAECLSAPVVIYKCSGQIFFPEI